MKYKKFKRYLFEKEIQHSSVAKLLAIPRSNFSKKINGYIQFSAIEIAKICREYNLDANEYFFNDLLLK